MDLPAPNTSLSLAEPGACAAMTLVDAHYNDHLWWGAYDVFNQANGLQVDHNILLAEGNPYGNYLAATPYDPRLQAYQLANMLIPGPAPYTTPYEMGPPFAHGHAFARTMTTPSPYAASTDNLNPENSSNRSTAGAERASKPRFVCSTCGRNFGRASDMQRQARKHRSSKYFQCPVAGCKYAGNYRKDKVDQHVKNMH